jgi:hypothetical protein
VSYHDLHITTAKIPRTSIFDLSFLLQVTCTRVGGWQIWGHPDGSEAILLAGEFDSNWLVLDVGGHVIVDSREGMSRHE